MKHKEIIKAFVKSAADRDITPLLGYLDRDVEIYDYYFNCRRHGIDSVINYLEESILQNKEIVTIFARPITYIGKLTKPVVIKKRGEIGTTQSFFLDDEQGVCLFVKYIQYVNFDSLPISFEFKEGEEKILSITINNRNIVNYVSSSFAKEDKNKSYIA